MKKGGDTDRSENITDDYLFKIFFKEEEIFNTLTQQETDHFKELIECKQ